MFRCIRRLFASSTSGPSNTAATTTKAIIPSLSAPAVPSHCIAKPAEEAVTSLERTSGISAPLRSTRSIRIYQPAKSAMQSGLAARAWRLDFDIQEKWENTRMLGWTSSADPLQAMTIKFDSKESAVEYANKNGWQYWIDDGLSTANQSTFKSKSYGENFLYSSDKLKLIRTK